MPLASEPEGSSSARSLKATLLLWLFIPLALCFPMIGGVQFLLTESPTQQAFDQSLANSAISLANLVRFDPFSSTVEFDLTADMERTLRTDAYDRVYYAVRGPDGKLLAGDSQLLDKDSNPKVRETVIEEALIDGSAVRMAVRGIECGGGLCQVRFAETLKKRASVSDAAWLSAAVSVLLFSALAVVVIGLAVQRSLAPLELLRRQVAERSMDDLRPLNDQRAPREVQPLVHSINALLQRVERGAAAQQAFLADAAHQLRTPLAVIKADAELAAQQINSNDSAALRESIAHLGLSAERAARLASQLLTLARSDASAQAAVPQELLDLRDIGGSMAQEWVPRALQAGADLGFELEPAAMVGKRFLLRELLANLIDNALAYGGKTITVRSARQHGMAVLEVQDDGPGIAPAERTRVLERFYRGQQTNTTGSGLGLAIVSDIARLHHATVQLLDAPGGGLLVRVEFAVSV